MDILIEHNQSLFEPIVFPNRLKSEEKTNFLNRLSTVMPLRKKSHFRLIILPLLSRSLVYSRLIHGHPGVFTTTCLITIKPISRLFSKVVSLGIPTWLRSIKGLPPLIAKEKIHVHIFFIGGKWPSMKKIYVYGFMVWFCSSLTKKKIQLKIYFSKIGSGNNLLNHIPI